MARIGKQIKQNKKSVTAWLNKSGDVECPLTAGLLEITKIVVKLTLVPIKAQMIAPAQAK